MIQIKYSSLGDKLITIKVKFIQIILIYCNLNADLLNKKIILTIIEPSGTRSSSNINT